MSSRAVRHAAVALASVAVLGGCSDAMKAAEKSFDDKFLSSCIASATKGGAPAEAAQKACDCTLGKINQKYSGTQKLTVSADKLMPLMNECAQNMVQNNG